MLTIIIPIDILLIMTLREYLRKYSTQTELARQAGVPQPSLSNFLKRKRGLSPASIAKIVTATGGLITFEELINETIELKDDKNQ
ncbi:MAG: helix-turn-helix domain-containing protein [Deltaproteobacteria bacterium]|nr:helix-turn-helix domain-containing protein [Deltaproteobacteria bacterium]